MRKTVILISLFFGVLLILSGTSDFFAGPAEKDAEIAADKLLDWSEPAMVSNNSLFICADSKVAVDDAGNVHVIWVQGEKSVYYNTSDSLGNWKMPQNITGDGIRIGEGPWPEIQVDNNGVPCAVFSGKVGGNYEALINKYVNNGWTGVDNIAKTPRGGSAYPTIAIDRRTNTYFVFWQDDEFRATEEQTFWQILLRFQEEGDNKWQGGGVLPEPNNRAYAPQAGIDANGKAYIVYANRGMKNKTRAFFTENADPKNWGGWSNPIDVSGLTGLSFAYPQIAVDLQGNVYLVWMHIVNGYIETFFRKRVNGVWSNIENLSQSTSDSLRSTVAVNSETGEIYVAWEENWGETASIFLRKFSDGKWEEAIDLGDNNKLAVHPFLFCAPSGAIHLTFSDKGTGQWNIYHRFKAGRPPEPPVAPIAVSVATVLDETTTPSTKTNTVRWEMNPENEGKALAEYLVYRKEEGQSDEEYQLIETVPVSTFSYLDAGLVTEVKYAYSFAAVDVTDQESGLSDPVYENSVFVPLDVDLETEINRTLFMSEKINTVFWSHNPLNDPVEDLQYNIYRKGVDDEGPMTLIHTANGSTFSYMNRGLSVSVKYKYSVTAIDSEGHETPRGKTIVIEEDD